jgi:hypothetical protein
LGVLGIQYNWAPLEHMPILQEGKRKEVMAQKV